MLISGKEMRSLNSSWSCN